MLKCVPEWYETQQSCDKAVDTCPSLKQFAPECHKTQKCVIKQSIDGFFAFDFIPDWNKAQEMCDRVVCEYLFLTVCCAG